MWIGEIIAITHNLKPFFSLCEEADVTLTAGHCDIFPVTKFQREFFALVRFVRLTSLGKPCSLKHPLHDVDAPIRSGRVSKARKRLKTWEIFKGFKMCLNRWAINSVWYECEQDRTCTSFHRNYTELRTCTCIVSLSGKNYLLWFHIEIFLLAIHVQ